MDTTPLNRGERMPRRAEGLVYAIRWGYFHRRLIVGVSGAAAALTGLTMLLLVAPTYESSAMMVVVSPKVSSDLKPPSLTLQGYQELLESDSVIDDTRRRLIEQGTLQPKDYFRLKIELETRIFVSRYSENVTLAPMVQIRVRLPRPEQAALATNTWAEVFLQRVRELNAGSTTIQVKFVDDQYPKSQERLANAENERVMVEGDYDRKLDELTKSWDEKVLRLKNETTEQLSAYESETKIRIAQLIGASNLDTRRSQLRALRKAYYDLQVEQVQGASSLQKERLQLEAARKQLSEIDPYVTLRKAITDDALWRSLMNHGGELDWKALQEKCLLTQEVNPVYRDLYSRISQLEINEKTMAPHVKQLEEELRRISVVTKDLDVELQLDMAKLEQLTRERESGLEKLKDKRTTALSDLMRERERHLQFLSLECDNRLAQLDRAIYQERDLNMDLAKSFNQAVLARAQQSSEEVRLGSPAVPPDRPLPRRIALSSIIAALAGALAAIGIAAFRDALAIQPAA